MKGKDIAVIGAVLVGGYLLSKFLGAKPAAAAGSSESLFGYMPEAGRGFIPENLAGLLGSEITSALSQPLIRTQPSSELYTEAGKAILAGPSPGSILTFPGPQMFTSPEAEEAMIRASVERQGFIYENWQKGVTGMALKTPEAQQQAIEMHGAYAELYQQGYISPETHYAATHPAPTLVSPATAPAPAPAPGPGPVSPAVDASFAGGMGYSPSGDYGYGAGVF